MLALLSASILAELHGLFYLLLLLKAVVFFAQGVRPNSAAIKPSTSCITLFTCCCFTRTFLAEKT